MSPRLLPLLPVAGPHGSRSRMTCTFRCGNACDHPEPNTSGNHHIRELLERAVARRSVLGGAAAGSAALVVGGLVHPSTAAAVTGRAPAVPGVGDLTFDPVAPNKRDNVTVPVGYDYDVVIGWGDKVVEGAPASTSTGRPPTRRPSSSVTTATTSACRPSRASQTASLSSSTMSTPTSS